MMYPYGHGMGSGGWLLMVLGTVLFLGLLVAAAFATMRVLDGSHPAPTAHSDAEHLLADRFAHGDIDAEEYELRLRTLRANRP